MMISWRHPRAIGWKQNKWAAQLMVASLIFATAPVVSFARNHGTPRDPSTIIAIVIHSVGGPSCIANKVTFRPIPQRSDDADFWQRILKAAPNADAHYVIGRAGTTMQVMSVSEVANHAVGVDQISIGIELVHRGDGVEPFEEPQIVALIDLIKKIREQYPKISVSNIVAHSEIDQRTCLCGEKAYRRRQDPGANFPMERVITKVRAADEAESKPSMLPRLFGLAPRSSCPEQDK